MNFLFSIIITFLILISTSIPILADHVGGHPEDEPRQFHVEQGGDLEKFMYLYDERYDKSFDGPPHIWNSGLLLTRIGEINKVAGSYEADFWFFIEIMEENDPTDFTVDPPRFNFINGKNLTFESESIEPHYYEVLVRGVFFNSMDFSKFPYESLSLKFVVEPTGIENNIQNVRFVLDPNSGIDSSAVVPGWETGEFILSLEDHHYDDDENSLYVWSWLNAEYFVERSIIGSTIKYILPISIITGLSLTVFLIRGNYTPRIYLTAPLLLSLVYLHQGALDEIPPVGYMTIFDKIMTINYALFVNAILSLVFQMRYHVDINHKSSGITTINYIEMQSTTNSDNLTREIRINNIMKYFIPIIIGVGIIYIITTS